MKMRIVDDRALVLNAFKTLPLQQTFIDQVVSTDDPWAGKEYQCDNA